MFALGALFAGEVSFMLVAWARGRPVNDLRDIATIVLGPTVTLLGTALGFYFSSRD